MSAWDGVSHLLIRPGASDALTIPLLPGSRMISPSGIELSPSASNRVPPVNATAALATPVLQIRTVVSGTWFGLQTLYSFFTRRLDNGQLVGAPGSTFGPFPGSLGAVRWKYGDADPLEWIACKVAYFALGWAGVGTPLEAVLWIVPYGYRKPITRQVSLNPVWGRPWSATEIRYSHVTGVESGLIEIHNRLSPKTAAPFYRSLDGRKYPRDYQANWGRVLLSLRQRTGALSFNPLYESEQLRHTVYFGAPDAPSQKIAVTVRGMAPSREDAITGRMAASNRSQQGIQADHVNAAYSRMLNFSLATVS